MIEIKSQRKANRVVNQSSILPPIDGPDTLYPELKKQTEIALANLEKKQKPKPKTNDAAFEETQD